MANINFEDLINNAPDAFFLGDSNGNCIYANNHVFTLTGYTKKDLKGKDMSVLFTEEELTKIPLRYDLLKTGQNVISIRKLKKKDGSFVDIEMITKKMENGYYQAFLRDISEIIKTQKKLVENESKYRATFLTSPDAIALNKMDGTYVDINEGFTNMTGYTRDNLIGNSSYEVDIWDNIEDRNRLVEGLKKHGSVSNFLAVFKMKDGSTTEALMSSKIVDINGEKHHLSLTRDVSNFIRVQEEALKQKEQLEVTLKHIEDGVITTDIKGDIILANDASCKFLGIKAAEIRGKNLCSIMKIKEQSNNNKASCIVMDVLQNKKTIRRSHNVILESADSVKRIIWEVGTILHNPKGNVIGTVIVIHDVTEYDRLMDALHNSSKLESLGTLAGGIAHDFNNLLTGIFGFINLAMMGKSTTQIKTYLKKALDTMERAVDLTGQLVTFASGGAPIKKVSNIIQVVKDVAQFTLSGSNIILNFHIENTQLECSFDKNQIAQVIDNIIINSKQTNPPTTKIDISITSLILEPGNKYSLNSDKYICITISDNGSGMSKDVSDKIFEPFFTTKKDGKGLGLATSYSIMKKHGGIITINSEKGEGSTFKLFMPLIMDIQEENITDEELSIKGKGSILIMDDEEIILELLSEKLRSFGYSVDTAKNGEQVLNYLGSKKATTHYIAMMFDLTVKGGMGGEKLIKNIREMDSKIPVFIVSGYSRNSVMANPGKYGFTDILKKPFTTLHLKKLLHRYNL